MQLQVNMMIFHPARGHGEISINFAPALQSLHRAHEVNLGFPSRSFSKEATNPSTNGTTGKRLYGVRTFFGWATDLEPVFANWIELERGVASQKRSLVQAARTNRAFLTDTFRPW